MPGKRNPEKLTWKHDGKNTDGSTFDPSRFGGWEIEVNGELTVSVPIGWETDGEYEVPIGLLELAEGDYSLRMRLVTNDDPPIPSDWSNVTQFEIRAVPSAPLDFSAV